MTEKLGQIQGNWDSVKVSGGVRVIWVWVTGVLLYMHTCSLPIVILLFILFRVIIGLTQFTNKAHIARATLEAVCFQTREVRARTGATTRLVIKRDPVWRQRRGLVFPIWVSHVTILEGPHITVRTYNYTGHVVHCQFGWLLMTLFQHHIACRNFILMINRA